MEVISHYEAGASGVSSVLMQSIPGTFTDLYLVVSLRHNTSGGNGAFVKLNGTTVSHWSMYADGTGINVTSTDISGLAQPNSYTSNIFNAAELLIPSYTSTTLRKTVLAHAGNENNAQVAVMGFGTGYLNSTSAVTSIEIVSNSSPTSAAPQLQYSTFTLYGISAGSDGSTAVTTS